MNPLVVVILNGVVHAAYECRDAEHAEKVFTHHVRTWVKGVDQSMAEEACYDDGYVEFENGSVCLTWTLDPDKDRV